MKSKFIVGCVLISQVVSASMAFAGRPYRSESKIYDGEIVCTTLQGELIHKGPARLKSVNTEQFMGQQLVGQLESLWELFPSLEIMATTSDTDFEEKHKYFNGPGDGGLFDGAQCRGVSGKNSFYGNGSIRTDFSDHMIAKFVGRPIKSFHVLTPMEFVVQFSGAVSDRNEKPMESSDMNEVANETPTLRSVSAQ